MPPKTYLVSAEYVRSAISARVGHAVLRNVARRLLARRGAPRPYYSPEQARALRLPCKVYDRCAIDAWLARVAPETPRTEREDTP